MFFFQIRNMTKTNEFHECDENLTRRRKSVNHILHF